MVGLQNRSARKYSIWFKGRENPQVNVHSLLDIAIEIRIYLKYKLENERRNLLNNYIESEEEFDVEKVTDIAKESRAIADKIRELKEIITTAFNEKK